jgi:hypothetical protein
MILLEQHDSKKGKPYLVKVLIENMRNGEYKE